MRQLDRKSQVTSSSCRRTTCHLYSEKNPEGAAQPGCAARARGAAEPGSEAEADTGGHTGVEIGEETGVDTGRDSEEVSEVDLQTGQDEWEEMGDKTEEEEDTGDWKEEQAQGLKQHGAVGGVAVTWPVAVK